MTFSSSVEVNIGRIQSQGKKITKYKMDTNAKAENLKPCLVLFFLGSCHSFHPDLCFDWGLQTGNPDSLDPSIIWGKQRLVIILRVDVTEHQVWEVVEQVDRGQQSGLQLQGRPASGPAPGWKC